MIEYEFKPCDISKNYELRIQNLSITEKVLLNDKLALDAEFLAPNKDNPEYDFEVQFKQNGNQYSLGKVNRGLGYEEDQVGPTMIYGLDMNGDLSQKLSKGEATLELKIFQEGMEKACVQSHITLKSE